MRNWECFLHDWRLHFFFSLSLSLFFFFFFFFSLSLLSSSSSLYIYICVIQRIIGVLRTKRLESGPQKTKSVSGRGGFWQGGRQMFPVYYTGL